MPKPEDKPYAIPKQLVWEAYRRVAALTNVVKYSQATSAEGDGSLDNGTLSVEVRDDDVGDADPEGHGPLGVGDRVAALGGRLRLDSRSGEGTGL